MSEFYLHGQISVSKFPFLFLQVVRVLCSVLCSVMNCSTTVNSFRKLRKAKLYSTIFNLPPPPFPRKRPTQPSGRASTPGKDLVTPARRRGRYIYGRRVSSVVAPCLAAITVEQAHPPSQHGGVLFDPRGVSQPSSRFRTVGWREGRRGPHVAHPAHPTQ